MSASQRPRRRKAQYAFEEEEQTPSAKRSRTSPGRGDVANGRGNGGAVGVNGAKGKKKKRLAYDEDIDGFQFTRTRLQKRPAEETKASKPSQPAPKTELATHPRKKQPAPQTAASPDDGSTMRRRRSARLSGEKSTATAREEPKLPARTRKAREPEATPGAREESPQLVGVDVGVDLEVGKKRKDETKIALPFADTPIIRRNKEMRAERGRSTHRRSSTGMRGRRASSLMDSGSNAMPHADVKVGDFYKHIGDDLPEPRRMRQLLTWCATRALPPKVNGKGGSTDELIAIEAARHIQEEMVKDFASKSELSDWFNREDTNPSPKSIVKQPNPRNAEHARKLEELEREISRLEEEERTWKALIPPKKPPKQSHTHSSPDAPPSPIQPSLLPPSQAALLSALDLPPTLTDPQPTTSASASASASASTDPASAPALTPAPAPTSAPTPTPAPPPTPSHLQTLSTRLTALTHSLEPAIDLLSDGTHRLAAFNASAARVGDRAQALVARRLELRDRAARRAAGSEGIDGRDVLRALAGVLAEADVG